MFAANVIPLTAPMFAFGFLTVYIGALLLGFAIGRHCYRVR